MTLLHKTTVDKCSGRHMKVVEKRGSYQCIDCGMYVSRGMYYWAQEQWS